MGYRLIGMINEKNKWINRIYEYSVGKDFSKCGDHKISVKTELIDKVNNMGILKIWCNECNEGIVVANIKIKRQFNDKEKPGINWCGI